MPLPVERAGWNAMFCPINTRISHPWLAPRETHGRERKRERNPQGVVLAHPYGVTRASTRWSIAESHGPAAEDKSSCNGGLRAPDRAHATDHGRRFVPAAHPARVPQPGRERPPAAAHGLLQAAARRVAHVPAVRRRALSALRRRWARQMRRRIACHFPEQESLMPVIKPRTRGKQVVRHITRLDRENNETLYAYAQFLGESPEYVLNQLVESVL